MILLLYVYVQMIWFFYFIDCKLLLMQQPIYNNKADPCGPMNITIGDGDRRKGLLFIVCHHRPLYI